MEQTYVIACLASQPSFPAYTDGGNECWLVSWPTSHMSEAPCQPCKNPFISLLLRLYATHTSQGRADYIRSLERLAERKNTFDEIWPSHANIPVSPEMIEKLHDGAQDILAGKVQGKATEFYGNRIMVYDLGFDIFLCDQ